MLKPLLRITVLMVCTVLVVVDSRIGTKVRNKSSETIEDKESSETSFEDGESSGSSFEDEESSGSSVPWWQILLIVICVLCVVVCCVLCCYKKYQMSQIGNRDFVPVKTEANVICHLCLEKISWLEWDSGRHRTKCEHENEYFLKSLSQVKNIHCPNCGDRMRQWLKMGPGFNCNEESCHRTNFLINNTGKNRFNCFKCDTDFCGDCVKKRIAEDEAKPIYSLKKPENSMFNSPIIEIESEKATNETSSNNSKNHENNNTDNNNTKSDETDPCQNLLTCSNQPSSVNSNPSSATLPPSINQDKITLGNNSSSRGSLPYNMHLNDNHTFITPPAIPWATHPKESTELTFFV